jgi:DNA-binding NtrC family response regulator
MPTDSKRFRVLVVDDERGVRETLEGLLSDDLHVVSCASAERALKILDAERFHVVCSDFKMPGMNGIELLRRVSLLDYPASCLLLTGADEYFRAEGGNQYFVLLKPIDPQRFISLILHLARLAEMKRTVKGIAESSPPSSRSEPPVSSEPPSSRSAAPGSVRPHSSRTGLS